MYSSIAHFIHAHPKEIAVVENATFAWQMAFHSIPFHEGDEILTANSSYATNFISYLKLKQEKGVIIKVVPDDEWGQIDIDQLEQNITDKTKLISIVHIPTNSGLINPVIAVGAVAKRYNIPFLLDACQSLGQVPVNVEEIQCDMLSATGRKYLRGPRGTGFLYVSDRILSSLTPPFLDLHGAQWTSRDSYQMRGDAKRFENFENNLAAKLGLGAAVSYAKELGIHKIAGQLSLIAEKLREELRNIPNVTVWDKGKQKGGIVTFSLEGISAEQIKSYLHAKKINVSIVYPSSALLDAIHRNLPPMIRASVHYFTTMEEVESLVKHIHLLATIQSIPAN